MCNDRNNRDRGRSRSRSRSRGRSRYRSGSRQRSPSRKRSSSRSQSRGSRSVQTGRSRGLSPHNHRHREKPLIKFPINTAAVDGPFNDGSIVLRTGSEFELGGAFNGHFLIGNKALAGFLGFNREPFSQSPDHFVFVEQHPGDRRTLCESPFSWIEHRSICECGNRLQPLSGTGGCSCCANGVGLSEPNNYRMLLERIRIPVA